jgi:hypothetical protein
MGQPELGDLFYLALLRMIGCTVDAGEYAGYFGDEITFSYPAPTSPSRRVSWHCATSSRRMATDGGCWAP